MTYPEDNGFLEVLGDMSVELIPCELPVIAFICPLLLLTAMVHEGSTLVRRGNQAGKGGGEAAQDKLPPLPHLA